MAYLKYGLKKIAAMTYELRHLEPLLSSVVTVTLYCPAHFQYLKTSFSIKNTIG